MKKLRALKIKIPVPPEDDAYYLAAMQKGEKSNILSNKEKQEFIFSLKVLSPGKEV
ncbi:hypothetical protein [Mucilaginibacter sp.]|uniref:hypothetical protein n=1 Tax=Mucilaginibacter sp. TaxID=1882438 RepID=UPI00284E4519|nr:hypothetical protein [Mucilaginibacter sp.]MDR3693498.1 hypothetical protein [Mucilaginibacter sp.]